MLSNNSSYWSRDPSATLSNIKLAGDGSQHHEQVGLIAGRARVSASVPNYTSEGLSLYTELH